MNTPDGETKSPVVRSLPTRIIAIDYGLARLGVAISDERKIIACPMTTVTADRKSESTAIKLIQELNQHAALHRYSIEAIVIGLPLLMSGKKGFFADETLHFIECLRKQTATPIITWDERLTSVQAEKSLREGNLSRKKRAKRVDSVAAIIILQNYLDSLVSQANNPLVTKE